VVTRIPTMRAVIIHASLRCVYSHCTFRTHPGADSLPTHPCVAHPTLQLFVSWGLTAHDGWWSQGILERDEFTLEEILDEDDVIQECKSLNTRLIVLYVVTPPWSLHFTRFVGVPIVSSESPPCCQGVALLPAGGN
jgi:hypothetical protein